MSYSRKLGNCCNGWSATPTLPCTISLYAPSESRAEKAALSNGTHQLQQGRRPTLRSTQGNSSLLGLRKEWLCKDKQSRVIWSSHWGSSSLEVCTDSKNIADCLNNLNDIRKETLKRGKQWLDDSKLTVEQNFVGWDDCGSKQWWYCPSGVIVVRRRNLWMKWDCKQNKQTWIC